MYSVDIESRDQLTRVINHAFEELKSRDTLTRVNGAVIRGTQLYIRQ